MKNKISLKIIFTVFILGWFILPSLSLAQTDPPPAEAKPSAAENINVELKVPLPFIKTTDGKVNNLKDYIEGVYRFLIGAGALFAVVMIIIAGYQWMLSGGSSDKTGDAKKRLWNASIGLVLALLSYIILNAISARLVELRLPKVDPVPPFFTGAGLFCATDDGIKELSSQAADQAHFLFEIGDSSSPGIGINDGLCGKKYSVADNGGQCAGNRCLTNGVVDPKKTCANGECGSTMMYGNIEWSPDNGYVDYIRVYPVCGNTLMGLGAAGEQDVREKARAYVIINKFKPVLQETPNSQGRSDISYVDWPLYKIMADSCGESNFKGFVLEVEVNNDCYTFLGMGFVDDDDFAMGKNNTVIHQGPVYDFDDIDWGQVNKDVLIPISDLENKAFMYNLDIDRTNFPVPRQSGVDLPVRCPVR